MFEGITAIIESIKKLVREGADVDAFLAKLHELVAAAPMSMASTHLPGVELYRATKHHRVVPQFIHELWHPPVDIASLGRANRSGVPMFYCSSDPNCAFQEIGVEVGQLVVHAQWVTLTPMLLHDIGYSQQVLTRAGSGRELPEIHRAFYDGKLDDKGRMIRDFLALAFTEATAVYYPLTAAVAEFHLQADELSGLLYPAVSKATNVDNLALRPNFVRNNLTLRTAQLVEIDEIGEDASIEGVVIAELSSVDTIGSLQWNFRVAGDPVPPGGSQHFHAGQRLRAQSDGEIEVEGKTYRIEAGYSIEATCDGGVIIRNLRGELVEPSCSNPKQDPSAQP